MLAVDEHHFALGKKMEKNSILPALSSDDPALNAVERQAVNSSSGLVSALKHCVAPPHFHLVKFGQNQCSLLCSAFLTKRQAAARRPCLRDSDRLPPASCTREERWESRNTQTLVEYVGG